MSLTTTILLIIFVVLAVFILAWILAVLYGFVIQVIASYKQDLYCGKCARYKKSTGCELELPATRKCEYLKKRQKKKA